MSTELRVPVDRGLVKHASLREAVNATAAGLVGLLVKAGRNEQYHYSYVGHEHVLEHTREELLRHGVAVVPTDLRFVNALESRSSMLYLWEQTFDVSHVDSTDNFTVKLQVTTLPGEQASAKASTAADRILLMRLCRLAGATDTSSPDDEHIDQATGEVRRGRAQPAQERRTQARTPADRSVATLIDELTKTAKGFAALKRFYGRAQTELDKVNAADEQRGRVKDAFVKRCRSEGIDARRIVEASAS